MLWRAWVSFVLGLWVLVAAFVLAGGEARVYSDAITGLILAGLAAWSLLDRKQHTHSRSESESKAA